MKINNPIIFTALALLIFTACEKSDATPENTSVNQQTEVYQMQEGDTQISGEVISIVGNEVTLALGEISEAKKPIGEPPENDDSDNNAPALPENGDFEGGDRGGFPEGEMPDFGSFEKGERPEPPDGEAPDFGSFEKRGNGGGQFGNKRGGGNASLEKSGESGTYIIPVGMTVSGLSGRSSDYSGISEGDILTLVIDSEGTVRSAEVR